MVFFNSIMDICDFIFYLIKHLARKLLHESK